MSDSEKQNKIDFDGLQRFLINIGFKKFGQVRNTLAFQHPESGTIVTLAIPNDGHTVRPADLLSILVRLECEGLVDESIMDQLRIGKLPMAS